MPYFRMLSSTAEVVGNNGSLSATNVSVIIKPIKPLAVQGRAVRIERRTTMTEKRQYDIILFGATGYTGAYCAEHIVENLPTNLKWAVAGRSHQKLSNAVEDLKKLNVDREPPGAPRHISLTRTLTIPQQSRSPS